MNPPLQSTFERVTLFQSGYLHGFRQQEVRRLTVDGRRAAFIPRRSRKEQIVAAETIVAVSAWKLPVLETDNVEHTEHGIVRSAKFHAFAPEWDELLNDYLRTLDHRFNVLFDGRQLTSWTQRRTPLGIHLPEIDGAMALEDPASPLHVEGAATQALENRYERDLEARAACLRHYGHACQVCDVVMGDVYGPRGEGFIHVHHHVPLSEIAHDYVVDPVADLIPVCPNCHAMLHRGTTTLDIQTLRSIVLRQGTRMK